MKPMLKIAALLVFGLALAGCSDSSNNRGQGLKISVDFTTFVQNEIRRTADDREPVNINNLEFSFNDQDNEQAFDNLF
jgi:ABC-type Fe3+-citrate transport system substrate-binding protein